MSDLIAALAAAFPLQHEFGAEDVLARAEEVERLQVALERRTGLRLEHITPTKMAQSLRELLGRESGGKMLVRRGEGLYWMAEVAEEEAA